MKVEEWVSKHRSKKIGFDEFIKKYPATECHSIAFPTLVGYYRMIELLKAGKCFLLDSAVVLRGRGRVKIVYYGEEIYDFSEIDEELVIISPRKLLLSEFRENVEKEIFYTIEEVFDMSKYSGSKSRYDRVYRPLNVVTRLGFRAERIDFFNIEKVKKIHKEWIEFKLKQDNVYRLAFPGAKYLKCVLDGVNIRLFDVYNVIAFLKDLPFGIDCLYIRDSIAYCMSSFNLYFRFPCKCSEGIRLMTFKKLLSQGVTGFNYGFLLNKDLAKYKTQWPHKLVEVYRYVKDIA